MARMTKTERIAREGLMKNMIHLHRDGWVASTIAEEIPDAWHTLEADLDVEEKKEKVTLYLDRSVARFYRAMGAGYQARINRLLATWAQMKIAQEVQLDAYLEKRIVALNEAPGTDASPAADRNSAPEEAAPDAGRSPPDEALSEEEDRERRAFARMMAEARQEREESQARAAAEEAERAAKRSVWRELEELEARKAAERARARGHEDDP